MPLSSDPSVTYNSQGNVVATGTSLGANATSSPVTVDVSSSSLGAYICLTATSGGSVSTNNGCTLLIYAAGDSTPNFDTVPMYSAQVIFANPSQTQQITVFMPTGKWSLTTTNGDNTNGITYGITSNPVA